MRVAIGLGSSMGPRQATLERAVLRLSTRDMRLLAVSRWYRSAPMAGGAARGWFLNGVALFDSTLSGPEILDRCRELEAAAERRRALHWADRPLDLDVLAIEGWTSNSPELTVPHPGILERAFVWLPLREVWPDAIQGLRDAPARPVGLVATGIMPHHRERPAPAIADAREIA